MYLAVDIGGTKTLVACFDDKGAVTKQAKFLTNTSYDTFIDELGKQLKSFGDIDYRAATVAAPGKIDHEHGRGLAFGNLPWRNVPIQADVEKLINAPVIVENDAKVAGLSEALLVINEFKKVLYITIGTGIGTGIIINGVIDPNFADSEGGHMLLEHEGKFQSWESFASGKTIFQKYGKQAADIADPAAWKAISHNIAVGLIDLIATLQPDVIIIGGGVGAHFDKFKEPLTTELKQYEMPLVPIPPIRGAQRAEEAVIYGCYELAKERYGHAAG